MEISNTPEQSKIIRHSVAAYVGALKQFGQIEFGTRL